jgi:hypothetical protein
MKPTKLFSHAHALYTGCELAEVVPFRFQVALTEPLFSYRSECQFAERSFS